MVLAGSGVAGFRDGVGTQAQFNSPRHIAADELGNIYVADSCNNCIRMIVPCDGGSYVQNRTCQVCPAGTFSLSAQFDLSSCIQCSAGTFSAANSSSCTSCPADTYSNANSSICTTCPPGLFSAPLSSSCSSYAAGRFNTSISSRYLPCAPGSFSESNGTKCLPCIAGTYSTSDTITCIRCLEGSISMANSSSCTTCPEGLYSTKNRSSCVAFPEDFLAVTGTVAVSTALATNSSLAKFDPIALEIKIALYACAALGGVAFAAIIGLLLYRRQKRKSLAYKTLNSVNALDQKSGNLSFHPHLAQPNSAFTPAAGSAFRLASGPPTNSHLDLQLIKTGRTDISVSPEVSFTNKGSFVSTYVASALMGRPPNVFNPTMMTSGKQSQHGRTKTLCQSQTLKFPGNSQTTLSPMYSGMTTTRQTGIVGNTITLVSKDTLIFPKTDNFHNQ